MRILWVKAGKILPVDTGGKIRSYNILRHLASRHVLTLLSYYDGAQDNTYEEDLCRRFRRSVVVSTGRRRSAFTRVADYCLNLPLPTPYAVAKFTAKEVSHILGQYFDEPKFDVVVCDFLSASNSFPRTCTVPTALFQHNVESLLWYRQAHWETNWLKKMAYRVEAFKMQRYERTALSRFHRVIAVSEQDRQQMGRMIDPSRISVIPTGVDLDAYHQIGDQVETRSLVVFTGSMDWDANIDGVEYFCREVWPLIRTEIPGARFRIVGRNPHERIRKLASSSIEVTGSVPSVTPHLAEAAVIVVPLRIGGGTRLKIYEAMAMGKAVVSSSVGAEGLEVVHGRDILLADDTSTFAHCVIDLLNDQTVRGQYGMAAAKLARQFDWRKITDRFEAILDKLVSAPSSNSATPAVTMWKEGRS